jgi:hypothetical protein
MLHRRYTRMPTTQANLFSLPTALWEYKACWRKRINTSNTHEMGGLPPPPAPLPRPCPGCPPQATLLASFGPQVSACVAKVNRESGASDSYKPQRSHTSFPGEEELAQGCNPLFLFPMGWVVPGRMCTSF